MLNHLTSKEIITSARSKARDEERNDNKYHAELNAYSNQNSKNTIRQLLVDTA